MSYTNLFGEANSTQRSGWHGAVPRLDGFSGFWGLNWVLSFHFCEIGLILFLILQQQLYLSVCILPYFFMLALYAYDFSGVWFRYSSRTPLSQSSRRKDPLSKLVIRRLQHFCIPRIELRVSRLQRYLMHQYRLNLYEIQLLRCWR